MTNLEIQHEQTASSLAVMVAHSDPHHPCTIDMIDARDVVDAIADYAIAKATSQILNRILEHHDDQPTPSP